MSKLRSHPRFLQRILIQLEPPFSLPFGITPDTLIVLGTFAHALQLTKIRVHRLVLPDEHRFLVIDHGAMTASPVMTELQHPATVGRNAHQLERHALPDTRQVQHVPVGGQERNLLFRAELPDFRAFETAGGILFQEILLFVRTDFPDGLLFTTLLHRAAIGCKDRMILAEPFDRKSIITEHSVFVQQFTELGRMSASGSRHVEHQLIGHGPPRRLDASDSFLRFRCQFQRTLEMGLEIELGDALLLGGRLEIGQNLQQLVVDAHRQIDRQSATQTHPLHLRVLLSVGTLPVGRPFVAGHLQHRVQDVA